MKNSGLKINGIEVKEGDVIRFKYEDDMEDEGYGYCTGKVVFKNGCFVVKEDFDYTKAKTPPDTLYNWITDNECEIIK